MQPRVTAIVVVRNGAAWLDRTIAALTAQTRPPDAVVFVDAGSSDGSLEKLPSDAIRVPAQPFGGAVATGVRHIQTPVTADDWVWLLNADTVPSPDALQRLLAAVEIAPSVAIAGPKVVDATDDAILLSFGESISGLGATVRLVENELDQAQHDGTSDVLGVASAGTLVRRAAWAQLDGFDPGLPTTDAALDLSIRARLAGHRVIRVPEARVSRVVSPEDFGRRRPYGAAARRRIARTAQLHRRLVYAPGVAVPIHWLLLVPLAVIRSIGHLLGKRPGAIGGELAAAFAAAFGGNVPGARRRLRSARRVGWAAIAPLRVPHDELRERRAAARDRAAAEGEPELVRASFLSGGLAVVVLAAVVGVVLFWRLLGASALSGGALLPLAGDVGTLWSRLGWGVRPVGLGLTGPADPFSAVLAVLGSLTPWNPSLVLVLLWLTALPLAALGAWWCATRLSEHRWPPVLAAALWTLAAPLLAALGDGRPGAVLVHLLLPWLVLAAIEGARSWSAAATASLLFAAVTASSPLLAPALVLAVVAWAFARPRAFPRLIGILIPAAALFAPLVIAQFRRGTPLALLADPGATAPFATPTGWQTLLAHPTAGEGWDGIAASLGLPSGLGLLVPAVLLVPLAACALLALFLPGSRRAIPAMILALAGLLTAVVASHLAVASAGAVAVGPWPGTGLSLYWLGLVGSAIVAVDALDRAGVLAGVVVLVTAAAAVGPVAAAPVLGTSAVAKSDGQQLPALIVAEASTHPSIGTLVLQPQQDGSLAAIVQRGSGTTLDGSSTLWSTRTGLDENTRSVAQLAGNLASQSGFDVAPVLQKLQLGFVVLPNATGPAAEVRQRAAEALDATPALESIGSSSFGSLYRVEHRESQPQPVQERGATGVAMLVGQGIVFGFALLLALPTARRRRVVHESETPGEDPADTFAEDDNG